MSLDNLLLGRSSALYRRIEALLITLFLIARGGVWRTLGCIYGLRRIDRIAGWEAGSQHTKTGYSAGFHRATWILTALDAAFFTSKDIKHPLLKNAASLTTFVWYLFCSGDAEEKVRQFRQIANVQLLRLSWEKATNPMIKMITSLLNSKSVQTHYTIQIPRSNPKLPPIEAHVFYDGPREDLPNAKKAIFQIPGGGFVAMTPQNHLDSISLWTRETKVPFISLNYKKAPENPYPYALEECYEAYTQFVNTNGEAFGIGGWYADSEKSVRKPPITFAMAGDSAGANLAIGTLLKVIMHNDATETEKMAMPSGLIMIYAALNFDMGTWISPSHAPIIRPDALTSLKSLMSANDDHLTLRTPLQSPTHTASVVSHLDLNNHGQKDLTRHLHSPYLALSSRMSYFTDRILPPSLVRCMALLYLGHSSVRNPGEDMFLSPVIAPDHLLEQMPRTWMMCGNKDPFVDDTIIWAARVREAQRNKNLRESGLAHDSIGLENDWVTVKIYEGLSHAYLQMLSILPEGKVAARQVTSWFEEILSPIPHSVMKKRKSSVYFKADLFNDELSDYFEQDGLDDASIFNESDLIAGGDTRSMTGIQRRQQNLVQPRVHRKRAPSDTSSIGVQMSTFITSLTDGIEVDVAEEEVLERRHEDLVEEMNDPK